MHVCIDMILLPIDEVRTARPVRPLVDLQSFLWYTVSLNVEFLLPFLRLASS